MRTTDLTSPHVPTTDETLDALRHKLFYTRPTSPTGHDLTAMQEIVAALKRMDPESELAQRPIADLITKPLYGNGQQTEAQRAELRALAAELRSGQYEQTPHALFVVDPTGTTRMCCLGVACVRMGLAFTEIPSDDIDEIITGKLAEGTHIFAVADALAALRDEHDNEDETIDYDEYNDDARDAWTALPKAAQARYGLTGSGGFSLRVDADWLTANAAPPQVIKHNALAAMNDAGVPFPAIGDAIDWVLDHPRLAVFDSPYLPDVD